MTRSPIQLDHSRRHTGVVLLGWLLIVVAVGSGAGCRKGVILRGDWALELNRTAQLASGRTFSHGDQCADGAGGGHFPIDDGSWPAVPYRHPRFQPVPLAPVYGEYLTPQSHQAMPPTPAAKPPAPMPPPDIYIEPAPQPAELPPPPGYRGSSSATGGTVARPPRAATNLRRAGSQPVGRRVNYETEAGSAAGATVQRATAFEPVTPISTPAGQTTQAPAARPAAQPAAPTTGDGWVRPRSRPNTA